MLRLPQRIPILSTWLFLGLMILGLCGFWIRPTEAQQERRPDYRPRTFAVVDATIYPMPGKVIESGTVVTRDGVIVAVGKSDQVDVPYDAEVIDGSDLYVYPGFLDLYTTEGQSEDAKRSDVGLGRDLQFREFSTAQTPPDNRNGLTPEFEVAGSIDLDDQVIEDRRELGFTALLSAPNGAIATGQSGLVSLNGSNRRESLLKRNVALHIQLGFPGGRRYGTLDQDQAGRSHGGHSHSDDPYYQDPVLGWDSTAIGHDCEAMADDPPRPDSGGYPASALMGVVAHLRQAMLDAEYHHRLSEVNRAQGSAQPPYDPALETLYLARARALPTWWTADTREEIHRVLDLAEEFGTSITIVGGAEAYQCVDRLLETGTSIVLTLDFDEEPEVLSLEEYREQDLEEREKPFRLLEEENRVWHERVACAQVLDEAGIRFAFAIDSPGDFSRQFEDVIECGLPVDSALSALTKDAAAMVGVEDRLGTLTPGKLDHLSVWTKPLGESENSLAYLLIDGRKFEIDLPPSKTDESQDDPDQAESPDSTQMKEVDSDSTDVPNIEDDSQSPSTDSEDAEQSPSSQSQSESANEEQSELEPFVDVDTEFDVDRKPTISTDGNVLIRHATVLTVAQGDIRQGSILIQDGTIVAVGPDKDIEAPEGIQVLDATGMFVMPGIIDTHSHMAISRGVNEGSLSIVPEVRVADVITGADTTIYRAAAGGTTAARLLHGSANTIGGQDAVIKMLYDRLPSEMVVEDRPVGVKFALGENVTRKRSSSPSRFPFSRMGVEATLVRAFEEGSAYQKAWKAYAEAQSRGEKVLPPRRDLRLEAVAQILAGNYQIHSHCYRADETLMLMRTAEKYGIRVKSLQHVLEGYKIAPEIAAHGASCSTFSDWWAYKVEAYDAIPHNAALLTEAGADVCIKSDSGELVRHLYLEAAKMVRYGRASVNDALAMITLNPAQELGIEHRMGSIEVGKDGDLAIFDAHPFDGFAQCQLTLIDGEVVFQRLKQAKPLVPRYEPSYTGPLAQDSLRDRELEIAFNDQGVYALLNATIHPVTGETISQGRLIVRDGSIAAIGGSETEIPSGATSIDLGGLDVWPGMIDAGNTVGLEEIGSISATQDAYELASIQPELRASVAIHPASALIPSTRVDGVLTMYVNPTGGLISGQGAIVDLEGWTYPEMVQVDTAALDVRVPTTESGLQSIVSEFEKAIQFGEILDEAERRDVLPPAVDPRLEALVPYARGEKPVILHAESRLALLKAIQLAEDLKLDAILCGGRDAWKIAEQIAEAELPIILTGTLNSPRSPDPYDAPYSNPAKLFKAGVRFAIKVSDSNATASRNLPFHAATAAAYGLPVSEALKAVTIYPAEILRIAETHGSLEVGKRANLVITAGHILQPTTLVKYLFIGGRPVSIDNKHIRLYNQYRERLAEVQAGRRPLGLERMDSTQTASQDREKADPSAQSRKDSEEE